MSSRRDAQELQPSITPGTVVVATAGAGRYEQILLDGRHTLRADEPAAVGGGDAGPGPYELLLMALGSCTSMTVSLYADRKKWPVDQVVVRLRHERVYADDCINCEDPKSKIDRIWLSLELLGALDDTQRARLVEISKQCPVHRTLSSKSDIRTELVAA
ncbi:MAG: OsmC family protein [Xanthobacteraceae bacterium]|nr:OsmC family protein [Xanthobacteraceae bacterium]